jgi:hypothetical protein
VNKVPDEAIVQKVTRQLSNRGMQSPCHIAVTARRGDVTLSGTIQYEHQRLAALHAVRGIDGVRRVTDHLQVQAKIVQRPITERTAPVETDQGPLPPKTTPTDKEKTTPTDKEKTTPTAEKTAPLDADQDKLMLVEDVASLEP